MSRKLPRVGSKAFVLKHQEIYASISISTAGESAGGSLQINKAELSPPPPPPKDAAPKKTGNKSPTKLIALRAQHKCF